MKTPVIVCDLTSDHLGDVALKKLSMVTSSLNLSSVTRGNDPRIAPFRTSTHKDFTESGSIMGRPHQMVPFFLCLATQVSVFITVTLCGSMKHITSLRTSDQYLIVKVIPLFSHIVTILGTIENNNLHCPFGTRNLLSNIKVIKRAYLHKSFLDSHFTNGTSSGRRSILVHPILINVN